MLREIMISGAESMGFTIDSAAVDKYEVYQKLLEEKNKFMNLTAITNEDDIARLHFLDSLALLKIIKETGVKRIVDIGSGAGFPGLPLKICNDSIDLTMIDALAKRITFLTDMKNALKLSGVECIHARAEEIALKSDFRDSFDCALSRAVAKLNLLTELCLPFVKIGGVFVAMKSTDTEDEINEAKKAIKTLGGKLENVYDYNIPGTDIVHRAIIVRKVSHTPKGYPRRFAKMQKTPL